MKKLFIGIAVFAVISVSITGILISNKNKNVISSGGNIANKTTNDESDNLLQNNDEIIEEKTIDLSGTYDENDLIVEGKKEIFEIVNKDFEIEIPQINGLKNKTVEDKVNNDIKNRVYEIIKKLANDSETGKISSSYDIRANFSNVLSGILSCGNQSIYINYELVNGERLEFEDLFVKDMDFYTLLRKMLYKELEKDAKDGGLDYSFLIYDKEDKTWVRNYSKEEDTLYMTENQLNKMMKKFMKEETKFYFSSDKFYVQDPNFCDEYHGYYYYFKDIADMVTIYDKYLTDESIYEFQNVGAKNLWTCSTEIPSFYKPEYGFATENLYYEISTYEVDIMKVREFVDEYNLELIDKVRNNAIRLAKEKLEEYKKIAIKNPQKFYTLHFSLNYLEHEILDEKTTEYSPEYYMSMHSSEDVTTTDISNKQKVMDFLRYCYRYYNLGFYGYSGMCFAGNGEDGYEYEDEYGISPSYETYETERYTQTYNWTSIQPDSSTRKLEKSELQHLTNDELNKAYNEIFARHGHEFKNKELREYFNLRLWYTTIEGKTVTLEELSEIERYNLDIIKSVINDKKM